MCIRDREAEHLTGPQLVLRLVEAHRDVTGRLEAASHTAQRLACDVQELLSGEEWDRLRGHVASVEADNARLRAAVGVAAGLAEEAWHRVRGSAPMAAMSYCEHVTTLATLTVGRAPDAALTDGEKALLVEVLRRAVRDADAEEVRNG